MGELQALHPAASSPTVCRIHPEPGPPRDSVSYPETCFLPHQKWMPWVPCPLMTSLLASAPFSPPHCLCPRPGLHPSSLDHDNNLTGQHPHLTAICLPSDPSQKTTWPNALPPPAKVQMLQEVVEDLPVNRTACSGENCDPKKMY